VNQPFPRKIFRFLVELSSELNEDYHGHVVGRVENTLATCGPATRTVVAKSKECAALVFNGIFYLVYGINASSGRVGQKYTITYK
jgi:hypothetical protein